MVPVDLPMFQIQNPRCLCQKSVYWTPLINSFLFRFSRLFSNAKFSTAFTCYGNIISLNIFDKVQKHWEQQQKSYSLWRKWDLGGLLPYIGYIDMCGAKGYGLLVVLVWDRVLILFWPLWSEIGYGLCTLFCIYDGAFATCFIVWNFKLKPLCSFASYLIKAYKHCL